MFNSIADLVGRLPRKSKISEAMVALFVFKAFEETVKAVVGGETTFKVKTFRNGTLTISCPATMASELSMRSGKLIKATNEKLGKREVIRLRFVR